MNTNKRRRITILYLSAILAMLMSAVGPAVVYADTGPPPPDGSPGEAAPEAEEVVISADEESGEAGVDAEAEPDEIPAEPEADGGADEDPAAPEEPVEPLNDSDEDSAESTSEEVDGGDEVTPTAAEETEEHAPQETVPAEEGYVEAEDQPATEETEETEQSGDEEPVEEAVEPEGEVSESGAGEEDSTAEEGEAGDEVAGEEEQSILEQVPDDTVIVVLNEEGEVEPLVSQEAAEAIREGDPIWCPAGQDPTPGVNGCTDSFASFDDLLTVLKDNEDQAAYQQSGTIYVETGDYTGGEASIDFNSYNFTTLNSYDLTLQGGWDTSDTVIDETERSNFSVPVIIGSAVNPWVGAVNVNQFQIMGVDGTGLTVFTQSDAAVTNSEFTQNQTGMQISAGGNVSVDKVQADNNEETGAEIISGGDVDVQESTFSGNSNGSKTDPTGSGMSIDSSGEVLLNLVQANNNDLFGANIQADGFVEIISSVFTGNRSYTRYPGGWKEYHGYGLKVVSTDEIDLIDVTASSNNEFGAKLDTETDVVILGGVFNDNRVGYKKYESGRGLEIDAGGAAVLYDIAANNNEVFGADIEALGSVIISNGEFNGNMGYIYAGCGGKEYYGYGLHIVSREESVSLDGVTADDNYLYGSNIYALESVNVDNSFFNANGIESRKDFFGYGLSIVGEDSVSLRNVEANSNIMFGANVVAVTSVNVNSSTFSGNKKLKCKLCTKDDHFYGYGIDITVTEGSLNINDVVANDNQFFGAELRGQTSVNVFGSTFNNNRLDSKKLAIGYGFEIDSGGTASVESVVANNNEFIGGEIQAVGLVDVKSSIFTGNKSFTRSYCQGKKYYGSGLVVYSLDEIKLREVNASNNNEAGARLDAATKVTISDSQFNENGLDPKDYAERYGLMVYAVDDVTLDQVQVDDNRLYGAYIYTESDIYIKDSSFSGNKLPKCGFCGESDWLGFGLNAWTSGGGISLHDVTASDNSHYGAELSAVTGVDIFGSSFNNNGINRRKQVIGFGLLVNSDGGVMLDSVSASNNEIFGADITAEGLVSIVSSVFTGNKSYTRSRCGKDYYGYGLKVVTSDAIDLSGVDASDNNLFGAKLTADGSVDVFDSSFNANGVRTRWYVTGYGLQIDSGDYASLFWVKASDNKLYGTDIDAVGPVDVTTSVFSGNKAFTRTGCSKKFFGYGIKVVSLDYVELSDITAEENYRFGVSIESSDYAYMDDSQLNNNGYQFNKRYVGGFGLEVVSDGDVEIFGVTANENKLFGASIITDGSVLIEDSEFSRNRGKICSFCHNTYFGYGLIIDAQNDIEMSGVLASENSRSGAQITAAADLTIAGSTFNLNGFQKFKYSGLDITASGDVILDNVEASNNGNHGVHINGDNCAAVSITDGVFSDNNAYGVKVYNGTLGLFGSPVFSGNGYGSTSVFAGSCGP